MICGKRALAGCGGCCLLFLSAQLASGHGFVGNRFLPATITTEDPFAVDELSLSFTSFKTPAGDDEPETRDLSGGIEFVKEIFPHFAVGVEENYFNHKPNGESSFSGWDNLGLSVKYELWQSAAHEAIVSIGLDTDIGGTGSDNTGESFTTFTPTLYFGKGFGDLPDSLAVLKPFAVTGAIGQTFPTSAEEANALEWGFAIEYSLPYLQQHVRDIGLGSILGNIIPLVEFSFETPENRGENITTGTINPGILFETRQFQLGAEALIPINDDSGRHVGFTVNLQIYIDDLAPGAFGKPLFGGE